MLKDEFESECVNNILKAVDDYVENCVLYHKDKSQFEFFRKASESLGVILSSLEDMVEHKK